MIVAVVAVTVVQPAADQIIHVIAVRHLFVPAAFVTAETRGLVAVGRIRRRHRQHAFVEMFFVRRVQMTVVQVVDVSVVIDPRVPAMLAVDMRMSLVNGM